MCQFVLFSWDASVILSDFSSVPLTPRASLTGAWATTCPWIVFHCLSSDWKNADCLRRTYSAYLFQSHFFLFSLILSAIASEEGFLWISRLACHSPLDFESITVLPPQTVYPLPPPSFASPCTCLKARLSLRVSPRSTPGKAGLTRPLVIHHLLCISQCLHPDFTSIVLLKLLSKFMNDLNWGHFADLSL